MKKKFTDHIEDHGKNKFDEERKVKELQRNRLDLENEVRNLTNATNKASDDHFGNDMYLQRDKARQDKSKLRHDEEQE